MQATTTFWTGLLVVRVRALMLAPEGNPALSIEGAALGNGSPRA